MDVARKRRIKRDWSAIFAECQHRDMTIKEFCLSKGMSQSLCYRRRKDYIGSLAPRTPSLRRGDFIELEPTLSSRRCASISFGSQIELSISNDCDKELLQAIISQLKGSPC